MYTNKLKTSTKALVIILIVAVAVVIFPREIGIAIFTVGTVLGMLAQGMNPF